MAKITLQINPNDLADDLGPNLTDVQTEHLIMDLIGYIPTWRLERLIENLETAVSDRRDLGV